MLCQRSKAKTSIAASSEQPTRDRYLYHDMKYAQCIVSSVEISRYTIYREYRGNTSMYIVHRLEKHI